MQIQEKIDLSTIASLENLEEDFLLHFAVLMVTATQDRISLSPVFQVILTQIHYINQFCMLL